eukprot:symbB.v1.2.022419.t1/scaffold1989.1/size93477/7
MAPTVVEAETSTVEADQRPERKGRWARSREAAKEAEKLAALVRVAHRRSKLGVGKATVSKSIERLLKNLSDDDEWELADRAAFKAVQAFLDASANMTPTLVEAEKTCLRTSGYATPVLDGMD